MTVVDVHAHYLPEEIGQKFDQLGPGRYPMRHPIDQTTRLADMDAAGVDRQVIGLGAVQPYWSDRTASDEAARFANDVYADVVSQHPGRLSAFAALPLPHLDESLAEVERCLDELGFVGIGLGCSADGATLDDPRMDPLWESLDERSAVVHIHPGGANDCLPGLAEHPLLLAPVFGSPAEIGVAASRLAIAGHASRYPGIKFVLSTLGGLVTLQYRKLSANLRFAGRMAQPPIDADAVLGELDMFWYDTSSLDPVSARAVVSSIGCDRLVFGSDAPWGKASEARIELETLMPDEAIAVLDRAAMLWEVS